MTPTPHKNKLRGSSILDKPPATAVPAVAPAAAELSAKDRLRDEMEGLGISILLVVAIIGVIVQLIKLCPAAQGKSLRRRLGPRNYRKRLAKREEFAAFPEHAVEAALEVLWEIVRSKRDSDLEQFAAECA